MTILQNNFDSADQLAHALALAVGTDLYNAIKTRGSALLAVSGGKTPVRFFRMMARLSIDWDKVIVTLVDERWVPGSDERSNEGFVRRELLQGNAAQARFIPLYEPGLPDPASAEPIVSARIALLDLPFDAVVLGMGEDGHCASFFADGDNLAVATDPKTDAIVVAMNSRTAGEPRITMTLPLLLDSRNLYLHIEGDRKRRILQDASYVSETNRAFPISKVLRNARNPLKVFWCP